MTDHYTLFGNPVSHSQSPEIYQQFAKATHQDLIYTKTLVPLDNFQEALWSFRKSGGRGANVTLPFKEKAALLMDELHLHAQRCGSVNTIIIEKTGRMIGDNTDGRGFVYDLQINKGFALASKRVLILGAGGAVKGLLYPIHECHPAHIHIANRTHSKADRLCKQFSDLSLSASGFEELSPHTFDIIINATSASLRGELPPLPPQCIKKAEVCVDLAYGPTATVFVDWVKDLGVQAWDGYGMLIEQAALSFELWRSVRPDTQPLLKPNKNN